MLYDSYEGQCFVMARLFWMTLCGSDLTFFDAHFLIDQVTWPQVDDLFLQMYNSIVRPEGVADELSLLCKMEHRREDDIEEEALTMLVERILRCIRSYLRLKEATQCEKGSKNKLLTE